MTKRQLGWPWRRAGAVALLLLVTACGHGGGGSLARPDQPTVDRPAAPEGQVVIPSAEVWGGSVRCSARGCRLLVIEHEANKVVWYDVGPGRRIERRSELGLAYHPDDVAWIDDQHAVAATEGSYSLDLLRVAEGRLALIDQVRLNFSPRRVVVLGAGPQGVHMAATPYAGNVAAWVDWRWGAGAARVRYQTWCQGPWHAELVTSPPPGQPAPGLAVACMEDQQIVYIPLARHDGEPGEPAVLLKLPHRTRHVRPTPDGRYWFATVDLGGHVYRYDVAHGSWSRLPHPVEGATSVAPVDRNRVVWGWRDHTLRFIRYDEEGRPQVVRTVEAGGFPERLEWHDLDGDGEQDLLVLNSMGDRSKILYSPQW